MKKRFVFGAAVAALLAGTAIASSAAGFNKVNTYTPGQFADVPAEQWYASSVSSAYELGFMKGSSATIFGPEGNMTVAEAVTIAARVNDAYHEKNTTFDQSGANWYDCYVKYATDNGIITEKQFDSYDRLITRAEMAVVFAKAVPADFLTAKNNVTEIPDMPSTNKGFDEVLALYNAGVVMGNDEFGTFKPNNNIIRAEAAAIINRIALPESRLTKTLTDANYGDAYYLIYDTTGKFNTGDLGNSTISAWYIDNRNLNQGSAALGLTDMTKTGHVTAWRDIDDVYEGLLGVDFVARIEHSTDGMSIFVTDDDMKALFKLETVNGKYTFNGADTGVAVETGTLYFRVKADLDDNTAELYMNGKKIGDKYNLSDVVASRFYIHSDDESMSVVSPYRIDVYKDYVVNDLFLDPAGSPLLQWEVSGDASVVTKGGQEYNDRNSAELKTGAYAKKSFKKISGSVVYETYMLFPTDGDAGYVSLNSGETSVAKLAINNDGVFKADGTKLRHHTNNIWQCLRIEADTVNNKVTYKVNGKIVGESALDNYAGFVDNITVGNTSGTVYFDDVTVQMTHTYDDYVPVPKPITDDGYDVILNICSLWREGTHSGWGAESAYPDIETALGYYDEGIAEVADWEIKFMVENGIDIQHLCWYCPFGDIKEPMKRSNLNFALHDGYFNAKYSDMMKFTFMWENNGTNVRSLEQFAEYIWPYWIDYYFLDDRYYTIDNKIVFTVWSANNFKTAFGGTYEGAKAAIEWMNEDIKKYGFDGVMVFFADGHQTSASGFENFANLGGTAAYAYHWQQDGNNATASINRLDKNQAHGKLHVVPTVSVGFNNVGWSGVRKPMAPLADHKKVLEHIKNDYLPMCQEWRSNTLIVSTWNEYGEGTYVMPCEGLHGFGYLENVAEVISGVTDHSNNIYPTEQQKARLGHLYPKSKTSLERLDIEQPSTDDSAYTALYSVNGEGFKDGQRIAESRIEDGIYYATSNQGDPITSLKEEFMFEPIDTKLIKAIKLVVKVDQTSFTELFFTTSESPNASADKCFQLNTNEPGKFVEYIIPTDSVKTFVGTLKTIRFDIVSSNGSYAIKEFALLGIDESLLPTEIKINNDIYDPTFAPAERDGELYVVAEPDKGFFRYNCFAYEWSRFTGKLRILTADDKELIFTVGSDKALVNGKEIQLKEAVTTIDGLPVLPLYFIYDNIGIKYDKTDRRVQAYVLYTDEDEKYIEVIRNRKPYEWEFEVLGDAEGFSGGNCTFVVEDGALKGAGTKNSNGGYDPLIGISGLEIDAEKYNCVVVGMKHKLPSDQKNSHIEVFFTTDTDGTADQVKSAALPITTLESDGYVEYVFNMSANAKWAGIVKYIRVDPLRNVGNFEIDYIRVQFSEEVEKENKKEYYEWLEQGFSIVNGDAEDTANDKIFYNDPKSSTVTIEKDEEKGNVWQNIAIAGYSYTKQNVVWEPGKKYNVSVDVKLLGNNKGVTEGVKTKFHCNAYYVGLDGKKDHVVFGKDIAVADGWTHLEFSFEIPSDIVPTKEDFFSFYTNPFDGAGCSYRFDNVKVTVE